MVTEPRFQLSARDHAVLQALHDGNHQRHEPFARLLAQKLQVGVVRPATEISPNVVRIGSQIVYHIDGSPVGPCVLVERQEADISGASLSIHTLHGLALLGLMEGASLPLDSDNGVIQTLYVESVVPQAPLSMPLNMRNTASAAAGGSVLQFRPRMAAFSQSNPDDDNDPGPRAA